MTLNAEDHLYPIFILNIHKYSYDLVVRELRVLKFRILLQTTNMLSRTTSTPQTARVGDRCSSNIIHDISQITPILGQAIKMYNLKNKSWPKLPKNCLPLLTKMEQTL